MPLYFGRCRSSTMQSSTFCIVRGLKLPPQSPPQFFATFLTLYVCLPPIYPENTPAIFITIYECQKMSQLRFLIPQQPLHPVRAAYSADILRPPACPDKVTEAAPLRLTPAARSGLGAVVASTAFAICRRGGIFLRLDIPILGYVNPRRPQPRYNYLCMRRATTPRLGGASSSAQQYTKIMCPLRTISIPSPPAARRRICIAIARTSAADNSRALVVLLIRLHGFIWGIRRSVLHIRLGRGRGRARRRPVPRLRRRGVSCSSCTAPPPQQPYSRRGQERRTVGSLVLYCRIRTTSARGSISILRPP